MTSTPTAHHLRRAGWLAALVLLSLAIAPAESDAAGGPTLAAAAHDARFEVLKDEGGKLAIDEVAHLDDARWQPVTRPNPNFGFTHAVYWGRFRVDDPPPAESQRLVVFRYPLLDRVEVFTAQPDGSYRRQVSGDRLRFSERPYDNHLLVFDLTTPANPGHWVYFRADSGSSMQLGFDVLTPAQLTRVESDQMFRHGAYYGLMLALALYNAFLFLAIRNRAYFWYVVYTLTFTFTQMGLDGLAPRYLLPEHPGAANTYVPLLVALLLPPPLRFAQEFLATRQLVPRMHRFVSGFLWFTIVPVLVALFGPYQVSIRMAAGLAMVVSILCAVVGVMVLRKGYRPARYYVIAWFAVITGTILYICVSFGLLPVNAFFNDIQRIGSGLEVVLLSFALGDHISMINREKDAAKAEAVAMERDLALTGAVQQLFLPKEESFRSPALALTGFYAPAARCGGDWWWYEPLPDGRVRVLLGDVTGHGAGAAMVTAGVAAAYRALPEGVRHGSDVRAVIAALNESLVGICSGAHHMTLAALDLDPAQGRARFFSAGAPAALVMHADASIEHVGAVGRPLGDPELVVGEAELPLRAGDRLFLFSDGLPEMARKNGRQLGYRGVSKLLAETRGNANGEARVQLSAALDVVRQSHPQQDDIAFVLVDVGDVGVEPTTGPAGTPVPGLQISDDRPLHSPGLDAPARAMKGIGATS
jgi:serine phosphatase RsbU (regulator of sigma subunit)